MSFDIVEVTRVRLENAKLTSELRSSEDARERDAETIRALRREVNSLNLLMYDSDKDVRLRRLERENEELRNDLAEKRAKIQRERSKRNKTESSLSEVEDDNAWLRKIESKHRKDKTNLKSQLEEKKSDLRHLSRSQENLQYRLSADKREYCRAEREFKKLENTVLDKRYKRRHSLYGRLLSSDSDSDTGYTPTYRPYRRYLY